MRPRLAGGPDNTTVVAARIDRIADGGTYDFTLFGAATGVIDGDSTKFLSAGKMTFSKQCIVYVITFVDAASDHAVEQLASTIQAVSVY